jgi:hypothetical protein
MPISAFRPRGLSHGLNNASGSAEWQSYGAVAQGNLRGFSGNPVFVRWPIERFGQSSWRFF